MERAAPLERIDGVKMGLFPTKNILKSCLLQLGRQPLCSPELYYWICDEVVPKHLCLGDTRPKTIVLLKLPSGRTSPPPRGDM